MHFLPAGRYSFFILLPCGLDTLLSRGDRTSNGALQCATVGLPKELLELLRSKHLTPQIESKTSLAAPLYLNCIHEDVKLEGVCEDTIHHAWHRTVQGPPSCWYEKVTLGCLHRWEGAELTSTCILFLLLTSTQPPLGDQDLTLSALFI